MKHHCITEETARCTKVAKAMCLIPVKTDSDTSFKDDAPMCVMSHLEPKEAEFVSPAPLCESCWLEWFTEGWES
jgi:hypothetical protein